MITFQKIRFKNLLSYGNQPTEIQLDKTATTLIYGRNGSGKCNRGSTLVDIDFEDPEVKKAFEDFIAEKNSS